MTTRTQSDTAAAGSKTVQDATCACCACVCDDVDLVVAGDRIVEARRACEIGKAWFLGYRADDRPSCLVDGQPASIDEGIERAARILVDAKYPLIYGLSQSTCEAQRVAVSIGDWIGGNVDTTTSVYHGPVGVSFQGVGEVTCSLGEIANRGDLIIFWGCDPAVSYPRHFERYSLLPKGMFLPGGRSDRTCVVVDIERTASCEQADLFLQIKPNRDFEALWVLRALAQGLELDTNQIESETGVPLAAWQDLVARMKRAHFGVILFGLGLTMTRGRYLNSEAVLALVRDMNAYTHFVAKPMRRPGNVTGADSVLAWQTGYPFGVNLSRGYPRFNPGEYTANAMLERGEPDAAMIITGDPASDFSQRARDHLATIPCITLDPREPPITHGAAIAFTTATYGINTPGTVYRMDDVPIPLRPAIDSPHPSDFEVLSRLERRIRELEAERVNS